MEISSGAIGTQKTRKLFYEDPLLGSCLATVRSIGGPGIRFDQTVAFPEGGGQRGDRGMLEVLRTGEQIAFTDTQKGSGRYLLLKDFPSIHVETPIYHVVDESALGKFLVGDEVRITLDVEWRVRLTVSHTASHLLFLGVGALMPEAVENVKGCSITSDYARFDFGVSTRFTPETLDQIQQVANDYVDRDLPVTLFSHAQEPEAWYWECDNKVIPCGGTHLQTTGPMGPLQVRRKNLGKNLERVIVTFAKPELDTSLYRVT